jgi:hypothetical protein
MYQSINSAIGEIRLQVLIPGLGDSQIKGTLYIYAEFLPIRIGLIEWKLSSKTTLNLL